MRTITFQDLEWDDEEQRRLHLEGLQKEGYDPEPVKIEPIPERHEYKVTFKKATEE